MEKVKIVTHNGTFHADEVFAVALLCLVLGKRADEVEIIRTRDQELIDNGDYVFDVGAVYDQSTNRYDHHQSGSAGERENGIPYSSFGLAWKHFGMDLARDREVWKRIDEKLVQPIDAIDCGLGNKEQLITGDVYGYDVGSVIDRFNPSWDEENGDKVRLANFLLAVSFASGVLEREVVYIKSGIRAEKELVKLLDKRHDPRLLVLDSYLPPVTEVLLKYPDLLYCIYLDTNSKWIIHAVSKAVNSFENRKDLPKTWAGKRDEELQKVTGVSDALFCHNALFIAGAHSKEGAIKMAKLALES